MITYEFFKNKRVTVFGLGLNGGGVATVKFLAKYGVREIVVTDAKNEQDLAPSLDALRKVLIKDGITYMLGKQREQDFTEMDMVIINPGIPWNNQYVQQALRNQVPVEMDASIFFQLCPCPIIGITGSKGKTTTSTLITRLLSDGKKDVHSVGIGQVPVLSTLDTLTEKSLVVFELSSWRLSSLKHIRKSPHIAVFTNIFPDHLNYYGTMEAYARDKQFIFEYQTEVDYAIYSADDSAIKNLATVTPAQRIVYSEQDIVDSASDNDNASEDSPEQIADSMSIPRVFIDTDGNICHGADHKCIVHVSQIRMRGAHNLGNILAAISVAIIVGIDIQTIRSSISEFPGIEHRLEFVREYNGVMYYNDTAATVPEACVHALNSFKEPIILIAGGNNKNLKFSALSRAIMEKAKDVVFFTGAATDVILESMREAGMSLEDSRTYPQVQSMQDAIRLAMEKAVPGDVVLLSPGATSFGLFKNEFDRGEQFREVVRKL